jgi:hypothetical protein
MPLCMTTNVVQHKQHTCGVAASCVVHECLQQLLVPGDHQRHHNQPLCTVSRGALCSWQQVLVCSCLQQQRCAGQT